MSAMALARSLLDLDDESVTVARTLLDLDDELLAACIVGRLTAKEVLAFALTCRACCTAALPRGLISALPSEVVARLADGKQIRNEICDLVPDLQLPALALREVGYAAFSGSGITSLALPAGVARIQHCAFYRSTRLVSVKLPSEGLTSIGDCAFSNCTALKSIILPDGLTSIGDSAFESCTSMEWAVLPASLRLIPDSAFQNCTSLVSVTLPANLRGVGHRAFQDCTSLDAPVRRRVLAINPHAIEEDGGAA